MPRLGETGESFSWRARGARWLRLEESICGKTAVTLHLTWIGTSRLAVLGVPSIALASTWDSLARR